jgi:tyrosyl-tRNA synthetase
MVNNADWLLKLNYVSFLRDIGRHFSINRMLSAECYKERLETGLTFLEFNYMIMQSYDFLQLYNKYGCKMQMGGNDQWSNIIGGVELIRRVKGAPAYGLTYTLLTTSEGKKMGKTESGAIWLDPEKTSPYDFYQYWRNVDDRDVEKCLALLTFLPMEEVRRLGALQGSEINKQRKYWPLRLLGLFTARRRRKKPRPLPGHFFPAVQTFSPLPPPKYPRQKYKTALTYWTC